MNRFIEAFKSVLLAFLGAAMLALWTAYIYLQFDRADTDVPVLENDFWIYTEADSMHIETSANKDFFSPAAVSLVLSGNGYTSAFDPELTDTLYRWCEPLLDEVFSPQYLCKASSFHEWDKALALSDSVLIEYMGELPYTTVAEFLNNDGYCAGEVCEVESLLLFSDSSNTLSALSKDSRGNVFSFSWNDSAAPSLAYDFNSNNLAAYTVNEGFTSFEFNLINGEKAHDSLPSEYKLLKSAPALPDVEISSPLQNALDAALGEEPKPYLELITDTTLSNVLDVFEINPHVVGYYSDVNSGLYFVGENMRLTVSSEGVITYSVASGEAPHVTCASLLDTARASFTSNELVTAATVFLSKLQGKALGGDARLLLKDISYSSESGEMTFYFGYSYDLAKMSLFGSTDAVSLTFNSKGLVRASLIPVAVTLAEGTAEIYQDRLTTDILPAIAARLSPDAYRLEPIYSADRLNTRVTPLWSVRRSDNELG